MCGPKASGSPTDPDELVKSVHVRRWQRQAWQRCLALWLARSGSLVLLGSPVSGVVQSLVRVHSKWGGGWLLGGAALGGGCVGVVGAADLQRRCLARSSQHPRAHHLFTLRCSPEHTHMRHRTRGDGITRGVRCGGKHRPGLGHVVEGYVGEPEGNPRITRHRMAWPSPFAILAQGLGCVASGC